jgi:predicted amino acid racemase
MKEISLCGPVQPYELDARLQRGLNDLIRRISAKAVIDGRGADIFLRIYMAGLYHGSVLVNETDP